MRLVLYEPDIPQNTGTMLRLGAALGVAVDLIEPCGFLIDDRRLRRAAMDYADFLDLTRWTSWQRYIDAAQPGRLVLLTTRAALPYTGFAFEPGDRLMVGRESAGVPQDVHDAADARVVIPLRPEARSINVATAAAMVLGEAIRQTRP
jgi:tRNA (cytidine/uridine-2'-O-)-methyltransferase